ncbi:protein of unknown function [Stenotrophomonas maltophilia]|nr:protein of unknown function [Stenotrophomonas maltophilia]
MTPVFNPFIHCSAFNGVERPSTGTPRPVGGSPWGLGRGSAHGRTCSRRAAGVYRSRVVGVSQIRDVVR